MNSRIRFPFYIFFLNPVYVAARSLRSLRSNKTKLRTHMSFQWNQIVVFIPSRKLTRTEISAEGYTVDRRFLFSDLQRLTQSQSRNREVKIYPSDRLFQALNQWGLSKKRARDERDMVKIN